MFKNLALKIYAYTPHNKKIRSLQHSVQAHSTSFVHTVVIVMLWFFPNLTDYDE